MALLGVEDAAVTGPSHVCYASEEGDSICWWPATIRRAANGHCFEAAFSVGPPVAFNHAADEFVRAMPSVTAFLQRHPRAIVVFTLDSRTGAREKWLYHDGRFPAPAPTSALVDAAHFVAPSTHPLPQATTASWRLQWPLTTTRRSGCGPSGSSRSPKCEAGCSAGSQRSSSRAPGSGSRTRASCRRRPSHRRQPTRHGSQFKPHGRTTRRRRPPAPRVRCRQSRTQRAAPRPPVPGPVDGREEKTKKKRTTQIEQSFPGQSTTRGRRAGRRGQTRAGRRPRCTTGTTLQPSSGR